MTRLLKVNLSILIFLISAFHVTGQTGRLFSPDEDLSNSLINKIFQDNEGFIWIATENGLNKFDGTKFSIYKHSKDDSTSIKNNYVRTVFEDSDANFWVGCINGLMIYDRATNSFCEIDMFRDGKAVAPHVTSIIETHEGDILVTTSGHGLFSRKKDEQHFNNNSELSNRLSSNYLFLVYEDSAGNLWIGSDNNGLNFYSPATGEIKKKSDTDGIVGNNITSIIEDENGNIFVGTLTHGLYRYEKQIKKFKKVMYPGNLYLPVKTMLLSKENILYVGTDGQGLKVYNSEKDIVEDYEINTGPLDFTKGKIHSIVQDKDNNLWLGIFQKGIIFIPGTEKKFVYHGYKSFKNNVIGSGSVMSIYKDSDGIKWVGVDNEGIYGINEGGEQIMHYMPTTSSSSISGVILSIFEDSDKNLWVGSYTKGLAKMNKQTGACLYIPEFLDEKIYCIAEDNEKNLLLGTYGSGFYKMNIKDGKITRYESQKSENDDFSVDELSNDWINDILVDSKGLIWLAHYKGASCYNPGKNTFINYLNSNTIVPKTIAYTLCEDSKGNIWIGTSEGLYVFNVKDESVKMYTVKDGLPNDVICGICEDAGGNMWVSTFLGISKFIPGENRFINYYAGDGLQGNEFTRGARFKDNSGKLYFGGINGVSSFYPEEITETKKELKILITDFYLSNHAIRQGDKSGGKDIITTSVLDAEQFVLSNNDNNFSIEFSTLEYANPERIVYQYMIKELGSEWIVSYPGVNRVTYTNLAPGIYTFMLQARDYDNYSKIKTVKIIITPPWYQSLWAYIVYTLLFMLLAVFVVNYIRVRIKHRQNEMRRKHEEQINEAKLQFFVNISHEIRTPMTLIINPLEKLMSENKDFKIQKTYVMILRNAKRILRLINQLMDIRKLDKGQMRLRFRETDIVGFIEDLMLTFEYSAQLKNINFNFIHRDEKLLVWIDLNNFDKILLNILSNAFKYTPDNGSITIELSTGNDKNTGGPLKNFFEIKITDDGIGIENDKIEQIFDRFYRIDNDLTNSNFGTGIGLHLSRSLIELHHGMIFAESREEAQGTRFIVRTPLGCDHLQVNEIERGESYVFAESPGKLLNVPEEGQAQDLPEEASETVATDMQDKKVKPKTKYRILVVEDEDEIREYIREELSAEYKISEASDGKKALEIALTETPDLIISDIMMPGMDGIDLSRKLKHNINVNHIPIILLTAKATPENKIEGLDIGADAYITKPFNTEMLKSTISNLLGNRERLKNKFKGMQQSEEQMLKIEIKSADEILMEKIMKIINENLSNTDLSVEMLALSVGMSRVHLHRKLKELTNQSARDFVRGIRLKQAAVLLSNKKLTISEVAYATGFSNISHFSSSFKDFYGVPPKEYFANQSMSKEK